LSESIPPITAFRPEKTLSNAAFSLILKISDIQARNSSAVSNVFPVSLFFIYQNRNKFEDTNSSKFEGEELATSRWIRYIVKSLVPSEDACYRKG
jgi:hypothetical protein